MPSWIRGLGKSMKFLSIRSRGYGFVLAEDRLPCQNELYQEKSDQKSRDYDTSHSGSLSMPKA